MKRFILFAVIATITSTLFLISCSKEDKDSNSTFQDEQQASGKNSFSSDAITTRETSLEDKVKQSVIRTFGKSIDAKITNVTIQKFPQGNIYTYEYTTDDTQKSTFVVIDNTVAKVKVTIDCTGTCDCRERVILDPNTGNPTSYECTCNQCKMSVTVE